VRHPGRAVCPNRRCSGRLVAACRCRSTCVEQHEGAATSLPQHQWAHNMCKLRRCCCCCCCCFAGVCSTLLCVLLCPVCVLLLLLQYSHMTRCTAFLYSLSLAVSSTWVTEGMQQEGNGRKECGRGAGESINNGAHLYIRTHIRTWVENKVQQANRQEVVTPPPPHTHTCVSSPSRKKCTGCAVMWLSGVARLSGQYSSTNL
jgi:hypothetical protein